MTKRASRCPRCPGPDPLQQGWGTAPAAASAITFTLTSDADGGALCAAQLAGFLTECTPGDGTRVTVPPPRQLSHSLRPSSRGARTVTA